MEIQSKQDMLRYKTNVYNDTHLDALIRGLLTLDKNKRLGWSAPYEVLNHDFLK